MNTAPQSAVENLKATITESGVSLLDQVLAVTVSKLSEETPIGPPPELALVAVKAEAPAFQGPPELALVAATLSAMKPKPQPAIVEPKRATETQKALIKRLRPAAKELGGAAEIVAESKCDNSEIAAAKYITELQELIAEQSKYAPQPRQTASPAPRLTGRTMARAGLPVTPKQWGYISHLRNRMRAINTATTRDLARYNVANDRKQASLYIGRMIEAARSTFKATKPKVGTIICSVCWQLGCNVGPMVPYDGR